jgi:glycosyltransferase 2 family protein
MRFAKIISIMFLAAVFIAWFYYIFKYSRDIIQSLSHIRILYLIVSSILMCIIYFIAIFSWNSIVSLMGFSVHFWKACRIWFISNLAKYIPGTIWIPLGRSIYTKDENISVLKTFLAWVTENYLTILSIFFVIASIQFIYPNILPVWWGFPLLILAMLIFPIIFKNLFKRILHFSKKFLSKYSNKIDYLIRFVDSLKFGNLAIPLMLSIGIRILLGIWLYLIVLGFGIQPQFGILYFTIVWAIAWLIGYIVIFLPGGVGLREGVLTTFLVSGGVSIGIAISISLFTRIQTVILDGLLGLLFLKE